jgi:hypothetical protein
LLSDRRPPLTARRLRHKHFFRSAQRRGAVDAALRFLALLPRRAADARTYTMAVSVCAKARDVHAALQARSRGSFKRTCAVACKATCKH